ncbi:MAG TPA: glycosyltransferase [Candidatus Saccharimonadales bacterium]|nr:glycosyltransferase [Candidatus Saccharimonadales bacterium]
MKIAFYMTTILEYGGGLEKYLIETAANLAQRPGITADVITMDDRVTHRITGGLSIFWMKKLDTSLSHKENVHDIRRRLGKARYFKELTICSLRKRLQQYDVIYSKNELIEGFCLRFLLRYGTLPPVIFGGHTPIFYPLATSFHGRLHNALYGGPVYRFLAGGVQKFHALNTADAARYARLFPRRPVSCIYNPFDIDAFRRRSKQHRYDLLDADSAMIRILWMGRLSEQKGVGDLPALIATVQRAAKQHQIRISWSIFGDGEDRPHIERLARTNSMVHYYGHADQAYVPSIYARHHIFVSTSKWEGYPYTLIEAQAFGLQIFAYDIPGVSDILHAYEGGHLAANPDELAELLIQALVTYRLPGNVPTSQPSKQFEPTATYNQLLELLGARS